jgi:hypothetical protein
MAGEPPTSEEVRLLRAAGARAGELPPERAEELAALADRLAEPVALPASERGAAVQRVVRRPDVESIRAAASHLGRLDASGGAASDRGALASRLEALAEKLAAYLPPKNGG